MEPCNTKFHLKQILLIPLSTDPNSPLWQPLGSLEYLIVRVFGHKAAVSGISPHFIPQSLNINAFKEVYVYASW